MSKIINLYHIYSRKHGDPERDYNFFSLEPSNYSQGNGNYRDVCQNRRNDVIMDPKVQDFNVWMFYNLIQTDGYNPLSIKGTKFIVSNDNVKEILAAYHGIDATVETLVECSTCTNIYKDAFSVILAYINKPNEDKPKTKK